MIFVTVGTHEQQFNRLIEKIDILKRDKLLNEDVVIQKGYSTYELEYCESHNFLEYDEMQKYIQKARIVITHGGPASFLNVILANKTPIVVPRKLEFDEHVNNHQVDFLMKISDKFNLYPVYNIEDLNEVIAKFTNSNLDLRTSNNKYFNDLLELEVATLFK